MARLNLPPTKSQLLRLKHDLSFAREGFDLLDQKRHMLLLELMSTVELAKRSQQDVQELMSRAYLALRAALLRTGTMRLSGAAAAPRPEPTAEVESRALMGIHLPRIFAEHPLPPPAVGLLSGTAALDEATAAFHRALEAVDRLAEVENAVFRLARELRKTQRRVNALEKIFLPAYEETLRYIAEVLEEREREGFVIMRMVKQKAERRRGPPGDE